WELKNIFNFLLKGKIMAVPAILFSLMKYGRRCALTKKNKGKGIKDDLSPQEKAMLRLLNTRW
ncbi:hypothetical protein ACSLPA_27440, partial [Escherichia coli]